MMLEYEKEGTFNNLSQLTGIWDSQQSAHQGAAGSTSFAPADDLGVTNAELGNSDDDENCSETSSQLLLSSQDSSPNGSSTKNDAAVLTALYYRFEVKDKFVHQLRNIDITLNDSINESGMQYELGAAQLYQVIYRRCMKSYPLNVIQEVYKDWTGMGGLFLSKAQDYGPLIWKIMSNESSSQSLSQCFKEIQTSNGEDAITLIAKLLHPVIPKSNAKSDGGAPQPAKRGRGRPPGAKNKRKTTTSTSSLVLAARLAAIQMYSSTTTHHPPPGMNDNAHARGGNEQRGDANGNDKLDDDIGGGATTGYYQQHPSQPPVAPPPSQSSAAQQQQSSSSRTNTLPPPQPTGGSAVSSGSNTISTLNTTSGNIENIGRWTADEHRLFIGLSPIISNIEQDAKKRLFEYTDRVFPVDTKECAASNASLLEESLVILQKYIPTYDMLFCNDLVSAPAETMNVDGLVSAPAETMNVDGLVSASAEVMNDDGLVLASAEGMNDGGLVLASAEGMNDDDARVINVEVSDSSNANATSSTSNTNYTSTNTNGTSLLYRLKAAQADLDKEDAEDMLITFRERKQAEAQQAEARAAEETRAGEDARAAEEHCQAEKQRQNVAGNTTDGAGNDTTAGDKRKREHSTKDNKKRSVLSGRWIPPRNAIAKSSNVKDTSKATSSLKWTPPKDVSASNTRRFR